MTKPVKFEVFSQSNPSGWYFWLGGPEPIGPYPDKACADDAAAFFARYRRQRNEAIEEETGKP